MEESHGVGGEGDFLRYPPGETGGISNADLAELLRDCDRTGSVFVFEYVPDSDAKYDWVLGESDGGGADEPVIVGK